MGFKLEPSIESLQRSLELNRRLLSFIQKPGSEADVGKFVVDMLCEEFPEYRVSYNVVQPNGFMRGIYSRQPEGMKDLTGWAAQLPASQFLDNILRLEANAITDIRLSEKAKLAGDFLVSDMAAVACLDFPFEKLENGDVGLLCLTHPEPREWKPSTIQLLREIGELLRLIFREARMRERLRQGETIFRQLTNNLPQVFWMVEVVDTFPNQRVIFVSPAYEEVWGLSVESVYKDPSSFLQAIHPEDRDRIVAGVMARRDGPYEQFYRVVQPSGRIRWIHDRGHPLFNEAGEMYRILGIAEDITALREAQEKLKTTEAQAISSAKLAALGEMAGGIAHEISNPLAAISALAQQMREFVKGGGEIPKIGEKIETIERMANSIAGIVKGLRTFSRQSDRDPHARADLCHIVRETLLLCDAKIQEAGASLKIDLPASGIMLKCRAAEVSQVVLNLVNNALDAVSDASAKNILIQAEAKSGTIFLSVEDSGSRIDEKIRDLIFQPFFTTKMVGKGTGLGLSISRRIVEAHGGKLYLDLDWPKTRFVAQLPSEA